MPKIVQSKGHPEITDPKQAKDFLAKRELVYEYWEVPSKISSLLQKDTLSDSEKEEVLIGLNDKFEYLKQNFGYKSRDLIVLHPAVPGLSEMLDKFDKVHIHTDDEVRYMIDGSGIFGFKINNEKFLVNVGQNDFISVPKGTHHWFRLDEKNRIKAVRYFQDPAGWVAHYIEGETTSLTD